VKFSQSYRLGLAREHSMLINELVTDPILFFRIVVIVIASVCLHELAHGWAAISQGDDTPIKRGRMTFNPVVHMGWYSIIFLCIGGMCWGEMPVNPSKFRSPKWGNILVSAAGPLLNLTLGILFVILMKWSTQAQFEGILSLQFLLLGARINLMLFLFNLLPIPPLDGFHVFSEIFPSFKPLENSPYGLLALMIIFSSGLTSGLSEVANLMIRMVGEM
jgi:Zn-dependent protease